MSEYGHDDAMLDLRVLDGYALGVKGSEDSNEHVRLAAYITRIESQLTARECSDIHEVLATNERLIAERNEALRVADALLDALLWCSGSADFGQGGQAEEGWNKTCRPLLNAAIEAVRGSHE